MTKQKNSPLAVVLVCVFSLVSCASESLTSPPDDIAMSKSPLDLKAFEKRPPNGGRGGL